MLWASLTSLGDVLRWAGQALVQPFPSSIEVHVSQGRSSCLRWHMQYSEKNYPHLRVRVHVGQLGESLFSFQSYPSLRLLPAMV